MMCTFKKISDNDDHGKNEHMYRETDVWITNLDENIDYKQCASNL